MDHTAHSLLISVSCFGLLVLVSLLLTTTVYLCCHRYKVGFYEEVQGSSNDTIVEDNGISIVDDNGIRPIKTGIKENRGISGSSSGLVRRSSNHDKTSRAYPQLSQELNDPQNKDSENLL